jgi:preprotein translocase subunit SecF
MKSNKKIMLFIIAVLIIAGAIMVGVKGFNVSLELRSHDILKYVFDQKFEKSDVDNICKEVFNDEEYEIKKVEVFSDAVYIIAENISKEQEEALLTKLNDLYKVPSEDSTDETQENAEETEINNEEIEVIEETQENTDETEATETSILDELEEGKDYNFYSDAKVRIRDIVKPYIVPVVISAVIICLYIAVRFRKLNDGKFLLTVLKTVVEMIVILLVLASIIAIFRIPFTTSLIPIIIFIMMICLVVKFIMFEKELANLEEKK